MIKQLIRFAAFSTLTLGLTAWIGLRIAQYEGGDKYELQATFDDVTGLFPGDDVKLTGVQVGKIKSIRVEEGRAVVRFQIDEAIDLPADSQVAVRWRNLIGQRYLYLYEGTATDLLPKDGSAVVGNATGVTDITGLVNTLGPLFTAVDPEKVNDLFTTLVDALEGNGDNLDSLLVNLNTVVATLAERDATLQQLLGDYRTITDQLASRDHQIETMIDNLVLLSQTFADNTALVDEALVELGGFSRDLDTVLTTNEATLASILSSLSVITDTATNRLDELEGALNNLPEALTDLHNVTNDGEYLNINVPCLSLTPPPCTGLGGGGGDTGVVPLDTAQALVDLVLGSLGGASA